MKIAYYLLFVSSFSLIGCSDSNSNKNTTEDLKLSAEKRQVYLNKGEEIVTASFTALSSKLKQAVAEKGIDHAIRTCNMHASPIADSLAKEYNAEIKRTAIRIRNEGNKPTLEEEHIIKLYKKAQENGSEMKPVVLLMDSVWVKYYAPITIQPLCLNCHGEPGVSMKESTYEVITELYPKDRAIGYKLDELRGIWSIRFKAE